MLKELENEKILSPVSKKEPNNINYTVDDKLKANKVMMSDSVGTDQKLNVNNANSVNNSQTSNQSNVTNIASNDVHNNKNVWVNNIA